MPLPAPGLIVLFGSGETAPGSGAVYDAVARQLPSPLRVAVLETPAGFQPNSAHVAGKVADFLRTRLQSAHAQVALVAARQRGTPESPDEPAVIAPVAAAHLLFLGPGSPTYTVRQLDGSRCWRALVARHRSGAAVVTSSAATIALGRLALPVYEIYKVGAELHWRPGLDLLGPYGLPLVHVPHWNNAEGGADLDTSRCFMGRERWQRLAAMLPGDSTVVGIDEHTALVIDIAAARCTVMGKGAVTILRAGAELLVPRGETFDIRALGPFRAPDAGWPPGVATHFVEQPAAQRVAPPAVQALVAQRQDARARRDWAAADTLRRAIAASGWQVRDTPDGPELAPAGEADVPTSRAPS